VEIDGLGTFGTAAGGSYEFMSQTKPRVFIAYVEEDLVPARRLRDEIAAADCSPWMDKDKLLPGRIGRGRSDGQSNFRTSLLRVSQHNQSPSGVHSRVSCGGHCDTHDGCPWTKPS